jgi:hypothetical protein
MTIQGVPDAEADIRWRDWVARGAASDLWLPRSRSDVPDGEVQVMTRASRHSNAPDDCHATHAGRRPCQIAQGQRAFRVEARGAMVTFVGTMRRRGRSGGAAR